MKIGMIIRALNDKLRREILDILKAGSLSAGEISKHFLVSDAAVSRHLSILKEAGLVRAIRKGKYIYYELSPSVVDEVIIWLEGLSPEKSDSISN